MTALRRLLGAVVAVTVGLALPTAPTQAQAQAPATPSSSCSSSLQVLLLVDQSASLTSTDPENLRVSAAQALVKSLSTSAEAAGTTVELTIAGFGSGVQEKGGASLPTETSSAIEVLEGFAGAHQDMNTDYVDALRYAAEHFKGRADVDPACKRLVWFTDGAYSIDEITPAVSSYTSIDRPAEVRGQLGEQVCGPLPVGSLLTAPLSEQIRGSGFTVQMIDLRAAGAESPQAKVERAETAPVIDRLLGGNPDDGCTVSGRRVEASEASALADEFFAQGQIALGRLELDCAVLEEGYPSELVRALTVRSSNVDATVKILLDGAEVASGTGYAAYDTRGGDTSAGTLTVESSDGSPAGCYADLSGTVALQGTTGVFQQATSSRLALVVKGRDSTEGGTSVGPEAVDLSVTVDGQPTAAAWDEPSRAWVVTVPGPRTTAPAMTATATAKGWSNDEPLATFAESIELLAKPPLPTVAWSGSSTLEGATTSPGSLIVTPAAATGGKVCVSFPAPATLSPESLTLDVAAGPHCGPDSAPFSVDATLASTESTNTAGSVDLPFSATYTAADNASSIDLGEGEAVFAPIALTKPADAGRTALVTALLVLLSLVVTLGTLLLATNLQRRMREPSGLQLAQVPLQHNGTALERSTADRLRAEDLTPLTGSRRSVQLPEGVTLTAPFTANPFGPIIVRARSRRGLVTADPAQTTAAGTSVAIPAGFDELVLVEVLPDGAGRALALVPVGTPPAKTDALVDDALGRVGRRFDTAEHSAPTDARRTEHNGPAASRGPEASEPAPERAPDAAAEPTATARPGRPSRPPAPGASPSAAQRTAERGGSSSTGSDRPRPPRPRT